MLYEFTPGRYLQANAAAQGKQTSAIAFTQGCGHWRDREAIIDSIQMSSAYGTGNTDLGSRQNDPVSEAFADIVRPYSVPARLSLRIVPMDTRILVNGTGIVVDSAPEHLPIPVLRGDWTKTVLQARKWGGIIVQDMEFVESLTDFAAAALQTDLARAVANAENEGFVSPSTSGSIFDGQTNFNTSGSSLANVDADLKQLIDSVEGAFLPGSAFVMKKTSATFLGLLRGTGGAPAFPDIGPQGGKLLGVNVIVTSAAHSGSDDIIGLIDPSAIFYADRGYELLTSQAATLLMDTPPTSTRVSMFQTAALALRGIKTSNWYARPGAAAYFTTGY